MMFCPDAEGEIQNPVARSNGTRVPLTCKVPVFSNNVLFSGFAQGQAMTADISAFC